MIRVKIVKDHKQYKAGTTIYVTPNIAHGLLDSGVAIKSKDLAEVDFKVKTKRAK